MATPTYDPIASTTLTSSALSVTFSSLDTIAAGYRDLVLVAQLGSTILGAVRIDFNGDTGANYSWTYMRGDGSSPTAGAGSPDNYINLGITATTDISTMLLAQFFDFSQTNKHKSSLIRTNKHDSLTGAVAGRWASTSAITSIRIFPNVNQWASGSTFSLYGIVA